MTNDHLPHPTDCDCEFITGTGQKRPTSCPHGNRYETEAQINPRKRGSTLKRTQRRESAAERAAREHFNETVKAWPCWFRLHRYCERCEGTGIGKLTWRAETGTTAHTCDSCRGTHRHVCEGPKDAHHLIPKQFIRQRFEAVLPEPEFVAILFNPKIGAPLCRKAHDRIESGADRIYFEDLSDECLEYVGSLPDFMLMRLELKCPKRAGVRA